MVGVLGWGGAGREAASAILSILSEEIDASPAETVSDIPREACFRCVREIKREGGGREGV